MEDEGKLVPTHRSELHSKLEKLEKYLHELGEGLDHERNRRYSLEQTVQVHHIERLEDRSKSAYSMLENERKSHSLRDEHSSAHRGFEDLSTQHENLPFKMRTWFANTRINLGFLKRVVPFVRGRSCVLMVRTEPTNIKRRMRSHPTWQFNPVRIASAMQ